MRKNKYPSVHDIAITECGGEWEAKSGGQLNVLYKLDYSVAQRLLTYDATELANIPEDIRGLRSYRVKHIPKGAIGANEWHKVRNEVVFALEGSFKWTCRDVYGEVREYIVNGSTAIFTPHHIFHTYESLADDTTIAVVANTLFIPASPATHDSYTVDLFSK